MKSIFTGTYSDLKEKLSSLSGDWDETQTNKKVLRLKGGVMNWFESTGTIQFQGKDEPRKYLENVVLSCLDPNHQPKVTDESKAVEQTDEDKEYDEHAEEKRESIGGSYLNGSFESSEIVIGLVSAVGTETTRVVTPLKDRLTHFGYDAIEIKVSSLLANDKTIAGEYERIKTLMEAGDRYRKDTGLNSILAYGAAKLTAESRDEKKPKRAYIINSLKHPDEVEALRKIYGQGFYLFGVHADKKRRLHYLINDKNLTDSQALELTDIDEDEKVKHGQRTRDTFHLADF